MALKRPPLNRRAADCARCAAEWRSCGRNGAAAALVVLTAVDTGITQGCIVGLYGFSGEAAEDADEKLTGVARVDAVVELRAIVVTGTNCITNHIATIVALAYYNGRYLKLRVGTMCVLFIILQQQKMVKANDVVCPLIS